MALHGKIYFVLQEIIADLCEMTKASLLAFFRSKRCKPEKIVMYRDGVSEGQFEQVFLCYYFRR